MPTQLELPTFVIRKYDLSGTGRVTCPRADCDNDFIVHLASFYKRRYYTDRTGRKREITGRPCPYCFRAASLPARRSIR